ncbi:MAG: metallophosphoesterase [Tannerella sp.]|jgi:predicted MPP superfamily phosphohydrolase|nr:metallophosphoesterase [Tannerella sp.]
MPIFFFLIIGGYLLANFYIFVRGLQALEHLSSCLRVCYCSVYWIFPLLLIVMMLLRNSRHIPFTLGHFLFEAGASWLIFTLYMVVFLAATDLIKVFNHSFSYGFVISLCLTVSILAYGYINYQQTRKQVFNILVNRPLEGINHLKIVAVSDLHLGNGTGMSRLHKNIDLINAEKPDLILIGGDLIDNAIFPVVEQRMDKELNRLEAPMGVFMVPGNHEYISGIAESAEFVKRTKIQLLRDSILVLPCGLQIIGRDDRSNRDRLAKEDWRSIVDKSKPTILLDHQPSNLDDARFLEADLQFSGHTHHGQVIPLNWLTHYLFELNYGFIKRDNTNYYVSSGLALWGPPFRIGTVSEMVVFEITTN